MLRSESPLRARVIAVAPSLRVRHVVQLGAAHVANAASTALIAPAEPMLAGALAAFTR
jgi:hypothetical protein